MGVKSATTSAGVVHMAAAVAWVYCGIVCWTTVLPILNLCICRTRPYGLRVKLLVMSAFR